MNGLNVATTKPRSFLSFGTLAELRGDLAGAESWFNKAFEASGAIKNPLTKRLLFTAWPASKRRPDVLKMQSFSLKPPCHVSTAVTRY